MNAVVKADPTATQIPADGGNSPATLLAVISRAASDPNVDIEKMERLMAMHREMRLQDAETDFNHAMARVQAKMGRISTDKRNDQTRSNYATYGKLDRALRPLYTEEGFALSFGSDEAPTPDTVRVVCHVSHQAGYTRKYMLDMPADGKGAKGNDVMTRTHATGSATQYGMRYLLKMIFNVAIGEDEDDDGNAAHGSDHARSVISDWLQVISECCTENELSERKRECVKAYGMPDKVPKELRTAFVNRGKELAP